MGKRFLIGYTSILLLLPVAEASIDRSVFGTPSNGYGGSNGQMTVGIVEAVGLIKGVDVSSLVFTADGQMLGSGIIGQWGVIKDGTRMVFEFGITSPDGKTAQVFEGNCYYGSGASPIGQFIIMCYRNDPSSDPGDNTVPLVARKTVAIDGVDPSKLVQVGQTEKIAPKLYKVDFTAPR